LNYKKLSTVKKYLNIKDFLQFLKGLVKSRGIIFQMVKKDFQNQYLGSFLGLFWAFFQPAFYIFILWFIFAVGFRKGRSGEIPFALYLMSGVILWQFISEGLSSGTRSILESGYLVKKMVFRVSMLPVIKILSSLLVHLIFIGLFLFVFFVHGFLPNLYFLQIFYYLFATIVLLLGLSWMSSALNVFIKDISQIIRIIVMMGFWVTPIFWEISMFPPKLQFVLKLNPVFYLINGYRDSLFYNIWFWQHPKLTVYFWIFTLLVFSVGALIFRRLRPHFADVL
jgi:lipopolysaccharide transport system permease protein/teichoic acid transport system permease protein